MASRHPGHVYRGAPEPRVDLPPPEIPKSGTPWFIVLLAVFAFATVAGVLFGFWRAANPSKPIHRIDRQLYEAPSPAPAP